MPAEISRNLAEFPVLIKLYFGQKLLTGSNEGHNPSWTKIKIKWVDQWLSMHATINSLAPGRYDSNFKIIISQPVQNSSLGIRCEIALR